MLGKPQPVQKSPKCRTKKVLFHFNAIIGDPDDADFYRAKQQGINNRVCYSLMRKRTGVNEVQPKAPTDFHLRRHYTDAETDKKNSASLQPSRSGTTFDIRRKQYVQYQEKAQDEQDLPVQKVSNKPFKMKLRETPIKNENQRIILSSELEKLCIKRPALNQSLEEKAPLRKSFHHANNSNIIQDLGNFRVD